MPTPAFRQLNKHKPAPGNICMQLVSHCLISRPQQNSLPAVSEGRQTERQYSSTRPCSHRRQTERQHSSTRPCSDRRQTERQHSSTGPYSDRRQTERQYSSTGPCSDTCMQTTIASSSLFSCTITHHRLARHSRCLPNVKLRGRGRATSVLPPLHVSHSKAA